jgi:hypothetical protein
MKRSILTGIAVLVTAFGVAATVAPADARAEIKSNPTGDARLDAICQQFVDLINRAYREGDLALVNGDDEGSEAWYAVAHDGIRKATAAGCKISARDGSFKGKAPREEIKVSPTNTTSTTTVTSPTLSTSGTPRVRP